MESLQSGSVNGFELFSCMIVVRPLHAGFEFPIFSISPSRIVYRMQYAGQCELSRLPCIDSSDVEDQVISGAMTVPLQMGYLQVTQVSKRAANASEEYYCRALKHVSLMLIISACFIGYRISKAGCCGVVWCGVVGLAARECSRLLLTSV